MKPTGKKNYGSIPHLLGSKIGKTDKYVHEGQHNICTIKPRDKNDLIIVQEKYDGSNVGIVKIDGNIFALTRSGYEAHTSKYKQHHIFNKWVKSNENAFKKLLNNGERICGDWMYMAHGLKYVIDGSPFVSFDIFNKENKRVLYDEFFNRTLDFDDIFPTARLIWRNNQSLSIEKGLKLLEDDEYHPVFCIEEIEGIVYRVERKGKVDFLAKYVNPNHESGKYFTEKTGQPLVINEIRGLKL